jgi:hypothetical protein
MWPKVFFLKEMYLFHVDESKITDTSGGEEPELAVSPSSS